MFVELCELLALSDWTDEANNIKKGKNSKNKRECLL
jgi:hypothetical protein